MYEAGFDVRGLVSPVAVETNVIKSISENEGNKDLIKYHTYLLMSCIALRTSPRPPVVSRMTHSGQPCFSYQSASSL